MQMLLTLWGMDVDCSGVPDAEASLEAESGAAALLEAESGAAALLEAESGAAAR